MDPLDGVQAVVVVVLLLLVWFGGAALGFYHGKQRCEDDDPLSEV